MITIPVTLGFDNSNIIGTMEVDETKLPPTTDYCFAIGYYCKGVDDKGKVIDFELREISVVLDRSYRNYLDKENE